MLFLGDMPIAKAVSVMINLQYITQFFYTVLFFGVFLFPLNLVACQTVIYLCIVFLFKKLHTSLVVKMHTNADGWVILAWNIVIISPLRRAALLFSHSSLDS